MLPRLGPAGTQSGTGQVARILTGLGAPDQAQAVVLKSFSE